jgi:hypothetical protein
MIELTVQLGTMALSVVLALLVARGALTVCLRLAFGRSRV